MNTKTSGEETIVALAKLVRSHSFPKEGLATLKADLFNPGGALFKGRRDFYIAPNPQGPFKQIQLGADPAPHGGGFGHARAVLLKFRESETPPIGFVIGLPRKDLPPLEKGLYLVDLLGRDLCKEDGTPVGKITGFADVAPTRGGSVNLLVTPSTGQPFEFPAKWLIDALEEKQGRISDPAQLANPLCVEGLELWMEL